jgi:hypothetical protein
MKIYKDKELTIEVYILDFGILEAGETQIYTFWVYNETGAYLKQLQFAVDHEEVEILEAPKELPAHGVGELRLKWSPIVTLKEGLKTPLKITAKELWG